MFDVITIGSASVDAFAETDQKYVLNKRYSYPVGDKIEVKSLHFDTGGGGTNTAVSFSRLGLRTAWIGITGTGENGRRIFSVLEKDGVDTSMASKRGKRTGFSVILDAKGNDRTILTFKGSNDDLKIKDINLKKLKTKWIYASSLMGNATAVTGKVFSFASKNKISTAFNPSLYLVERGKSVLKPILSNTDVLVYNKEEAQELTKKEDMQNLLISSQKMLKREGIVVITDGPNGAHAFDGNYIYTASTHHIKIKETTGAGDAFASTFVAMLAKGKDIYFALKAAIINSESVIQHLGAKNKLMGWEELLREMKKCRCRIGMKRV